MGNDDRVLMEEMEQGKLGCQLVRSKQYPNQTNQISRLGSSENSIKFSGWKHGIKLDRFYFRFMGLIYPNQKYELEF